MIISRTFPRSASANRSPPKTSSIAPNLWLLSPIGVFLLGLTHPHEPDFVFGIPREYAFSFFHNNRDTIRSASTNSDQSYNLILLHFRFNHPTIHYSFFYCTLAMPTRHGFPLKSSAGQQSGSH